jgi:hypothetical protein
LTRNDFFSKFDFYNSFTKVATQTKSIDVLKPSYADPAELAQKVLGYARVVARADLDKVNEALGFLGNIPDTASSATCRCFAERRNIGAMERPAVTADRAESLNITVRYRAFRG